MAAAVSPQKPSHAATATGFVRQASRYLDDVTDTAFYRNPHYHSSADTPEKLSYARMAQVVEGLCGAVAALAQAV